MRGTVMGTGDRILTAGLIVAGLIALMLCVEAVRWVAASPGGSNPAEVIFNEEGQPILLRLEDGTLYTQP